MYHGCVTIPEVPPKAPPATRNDRVGTMLAKCEEYHTWGVPFCWVIDPVKRTAWEYHAAQEPARATATLHAGEISLSLKELFSALPAAP